ncbi:TraR/DksA C4-type zinc finger protein [Candidatus Daviesbacteria bacterium]|nr:TraR/DksA C4-type zinc finger protein [Candidatus Daviesbacteria bacterium]
MLKLTRKSLSTIKNILLRQQKQVERNLKEVEKDDPVTTPALAESTETGTDSSIADTHGKSLVFEKSLTNVKTSIIAALQKIKNRTYGKCEQCGQQIEIGRLLAMPTARYCLSCSKKSTLNKS